MTQLYLPHIVSTPPPPDMEPLQDEPPEEPEAPEPFPRTPDIHWAGPAYRPGQKSSGYG